jgi:cysteine-S-conjugate beta-lyase
MSDQHERCAPEGLRHAPRARGSRAVRTEGLPVDPPVVCAGTAVFDTVAAQGEVRAQPDQERLFTSGARGTPTGLPMNR